MNSGLVMWNDRLTLSQIAQSSLASPQFAFLSSCQSATGSKQFPNEAVHLAAGLQFVGFRSVIGTMWSVGDEDALISRTEIYNHRLHHFASELGDIYESYNRKVTLRSLILHFS